MRGGERGGERASERGSERGASERGGERAREGARGERVRDVDRFFQPSPDIGHQTIKRFPLMYLILTGCGLWEGLDRVGHDTTTRVDS